MNRKHKPGLKTSVESGIATIAADASLTLFQINGPFHTLCDLATCPLPGAAMADILPAPLLAALDTSQPIQTTEIKLHNSAGKSRYLHVTIIPSEQKIAGQAFFQILLTDITALQERHTRAEQEKQQYKILTDIFEDIPFEYDLDTDLMTFSVRFRDTFGGEPLIPLFSQYIRALPEDNICFSFQVLLKQKSEACSKAMFEFQAMTKDGSPRWFFIFCRLVVADHKQHARFVGAIRDIDRQKREQLKLLGQAKSDPMTGLLNKSTSEEEIRTALQNAHPGALGVLMMLDIDNFKMVNDTMGHLAGDSVIHQVAHQLATLFRKNDIIGRVGGDEFHIFMRDVADPSLITEKADKLCESIRKLFINSNLGHEISISVGISFTDHPVEYEELFSEADIALYHAKSHGKNRFEIFGQTDDVTGDKNQPQSPLAINAVRNSIMVDIIDILFSMGDIHEGIEKVLYFIGNALRVDKIIITEKSIDFLTLSITHEWSSNNEWRIKNQYQNISLAKISLPKANSNGIFYCTDTSFLSSEEKVFLKDEGVTSLLQCSIIREGQEVGYISFEERGDRRIWTQQEVDTLILMSKLLGEYIRQRRSTSLLHKTNESTRNILNSLSATAVYVISRDAHKILYCNDTVTRLFPHSASDITCHEIFWGQKTPCPFCPAHNIGKADFISSILYNTPFWQTADISLSTIVWENQIPAYVVILSQHVQSDAEAALAKKREAFSHALSDSYDNVMVIDPRTGRYELLSSSTSSSVMLPASGDYAECLAYICSHHIESAYKKKFSILFSLKEMNIAFASGVQEIEMDFERCTPAGLCWKHRKAFRYTLDDGTQHIIAYNYDITKSKEEEFLRQQEENCLFNILQNGYTEIYEINLQKNFVRMIHRGNKSYQLPPLSSSYSQDIKNIADTCVFPDDRTRFLEHYDPATILARLAQHEPCRVEYRVKGQQGCTSIVSQILPMPTRPGQASNRMLFLCRDVTDERKQADANRAQQRITEQYDRALRNIYDELYEINVTRNAYHIVYHVKGKYVTPSEEGNLSEVIDLVASTMIHPDDHDRFQQFFDLNAVRTHFAIDHDCLIGEFRKLWQDGKFHWASLTMFPVPLSTDNDETYLVFIMDIEAKKKAEEMVQKNTFLEHQRITDERYKIIVKQTNTLVFEWYPGENIRYVAPEISQRFTGIYDGRDIADIWIEDHVIHQDDVPLFIELIKNIHAGKNYAERTVRLRAHDNTYRWSKVAFTSLYDNEENTRRIIGTLNDVDDATRAIHDLQYRAEYDTLTGIHNAQTFYNDAEKLLHHCADHPYYVIRMDVDRFKVINDLYGLAEGDRLLQTIARLLSEHITGTACYGRISGDIFCMCVDYTSEEIINRISNIVETLDHYPLPYKIAVSFGICKVDNASTPINVLCDWANLALKTIKGNYLKSFAFYDEKLRDKILNEKKIESEMHEALLQEQFVMFLQPKVDIATSRIVGSEALVRWQHPTEGLIEPARFVPLFEKNGFVGRLDEYIWEQACKALRHWLDKGYKPGPISVNVSRLHFHGTRLRNKLLELVTTYAIPPELLELELTETAFLENEREIADIMLSIQHYGFRFSMDDFGSGYSSLTMLKTLPINIVKIDRGFLNESVASNHGQIIISHTISMAQQMNLKVIAEGVETVEQALFLLKTGCRFAQGYFYSRPIPREQFESLAFEQNGVSFPVPEIICEYLTEATGISISD